MSGEIEHGGRRGPAREPQRDYEARLKLRMLNSNWIVPSDQIKEVRDSIVDVATNSADHRARIGAATFLFNAEVAIVQAEHAINDGQAIQDTGEEPKPVEPENSEELD